MHDFVDRPRPLRDSDAFNLEAVNQWVLENVPTLVGSPEVFQYPGGASNLTYLLAYKNKDVILRRPPPGHKAKSAHDMGREYKVMKALKNQYPYVPEMIAFCEDEKLIGGQFYLMERMKGIIPRKDFPRGMSIDKESAKKLCFGLFDKLIELHKVDIEKAGLSDLGKGKGYVQRQVDGWIDRFERSKTWNVPGFKTITSWLKENRPDDVSTCLIHNDFRFDNAVFDPNDPGNIIGVLDWEMATLGDPLMDLGGALAYWVEEKDDFAFRWLRRQPSNIPGMLTRNEIVDYYCEKMNFDRGLWPFYQIFGLFRLAVIIQQIYYRYYKGQTDNPIFKNFWFFVHLLSFRCHKILKKGPI